MPLRVVILLFVIACGARATPLDGDVVTTAPTTPPPPFTPEQLRAGLPVGTQIQYSVQRGGQSAYELHYVVTAADATNVTIEATTIHGDGRREVAPAEPTTWAELASHGRFPADRTRVYAAQATTYAGSLATRAYEVTDPSGVISTSYFALDMPGPPVLLETLDGRALVMKMSLIARTR